MPMELMMLTVLTIARREGEHNKRHSGYYISTDLENEDAGANAPSYGPESIEARFVSCTSRARQDTDSRVGLYAETAYNVT